MSENTIVVTTSGFFASQPEVADLAALLLAEHITRFVGRTAGPAWAAERELRGVLGIAAGKRGGRAVMNDALKVATAEYNRLMGESSAAMIAGNMTRLAELCPLVAEAAVKQVAARKTERTAGTLRQLQLDCEDTAHSAEPRFVSSKLAESASAALTTLYPALSEFATSPDGTGSEYLDHALGAVRTLDSLLADNVPIVELGAPVQTALAKAAELKALRVDAEAKLAIRVKALETLGDSAGDTEETTAERAALTEQIAKFETCVKSAKTEETNAARKAERLQKEASEVAAVKFAAPTEDGAPS